MQLFLITGHMPCNNRWQIITSDVISFNHLFFFIFYAVWFLRHCSCWLRYSVRTEVSFTFYSFSFLHQLIGLDVKSLSLSLWQLYLCLLCRRSALTNQSGSRGRVTWREWESGGCSATSVTQQWLQTRTSCEVCSPRRISEANGVSKPQGCRGIATVSSWNWWRSPLLSWAATSPHKTMQRIIIFKVFHYGRLTLANSDLTL